MAEYLASIDFDEHCVEVPGICMGCPKEDDLDGYADNVIKYGSKLLDAANHMSLLAVIAYAYQNDIEIDAWLKEYAENNNTYILNQKQNFLQMRNDLNKYQERMGVA